MAETKQQTADVPVWPFEVVGPPEPCACGGCRFERLQDGAAWACKRCQVVVKQGEPVIEAG